jgi:hypothetical protein
MEEYQNINHMPRPQCSDEEPLFPSNSKPTEQNDKSLVVIYHDEMSMKLMWGSGDKPAIFPNSGIMVSYFTDEYRSYLSLSAE